MMCDIDETVVYGAEGVCRYAGISERDVGGTRCSYYVLRPVYNDHSTIFVPVDNQKLTAKMRRVLSADEIHDLIRALPGVDTIWIEDEAARGEEYRRILSGGDRKELARLIKTLYLRRQSQKGKGRKMHITDERIMKEAERMLHEEFAHVLNIKREQVLPLILEQIQPEEAE